MKLVFLLVFVYIQVPTRVFSLENPHFSFCLNESWECWPEDSAVSGKMGSREGRGNGTPCKEGSTAGASHPVGHTRKA